MARSILDRLLGENKNETKYEPYNFDKKYGGKVPTEAEFLTEFDEKLSRVLDKMREEGKPEQQLYWR